MSEQDSFVKVPDPSDLLSRRAGKEGYIQANGREYTKLQWVEKLAREGATLQSGEGAMLVAEIDRLRDALRGWIKGV